MKKVLISVLTVAFLLSAATLLCSCAAPSESEKAQEEISGTFTYNPPFEDAAREETYYYNDGFFKVSGKAENLKLLEMSYDLAISLSEIRKCEYTAKLLTEIGFKDVTSTEINEAPTKETIGTVIAHKKVDGKNVIAVVIRGDNYEREWASNVTVGKTGDAKGFSDARNKVLSRLKKYIEKYSLKDNKIWAMGYSRSGAVANLLGVSLNKDLKSFSTTADDIYIYAFEPPAACAEDTVYQNINVVLNAGDLVTYVCPAAWDLHVNGKTVLIGEDKAVKTYYNLLTPTEYGETTQKSFLAEFFGWMAGRLSREEYADNLEAPIADILEIVFSKTEEERTQIANFFLGLTSALDGDLMMKMQLASALMNCTAHKSAYLYDRVTDIIVGVLDNARNRESASPFTNAEFSIIKNSLYPILRTLLPIVIDDMHYFEGIDYDEYYAKNLPDYFLSDYDYGHKKGESNGFTYGYADGFDEKTYNDAVKDNQEFGSDYKNGYKDGYKKGYGDGYELGVAHAENVLPNDEHDEEEPPTALSCYHFISFAKNVLALANNHFTQVNLDYIKRLCENA